MGKVSEVLLEGDQVLMIPSSLYCGLGLKVYEVFLCVVVEMSIPHS